MPCHQRFAARFWDGTFAPSRRASERPIATACLRLVTCFPDLPLRSVPDFISCIARSTFLDAFAPYLAIVHPPLINRHGARKGRAHARDVGTTAFESRPHEGTLQSSFMSSCHVGQEGAQLRDEFRARTCDRPDGTPSLIAVDHYNTPIPVLLAELRHGVGSGSLIRDPGLTG